MNKTTITVVSCSVVVGSFIKGAVKKFSEIKHQEEQKRKKLDADYERQLIAIAVSEGRIKERIWSGYYDKKPNAIENVISDMEFERIAHLEQ